MGDDIPIRTLGDYSKPSHEGYRNTIELLAGNNVDPNQHLKDFLKLVDSLDLDGENRERTRLRLFQFCLRDQASNWLEHLPARSISTWEDLTTGFLAQFFPPGRTVKLRNDILMFQQHHGESLSEAWTRFKDLLQKVPYHGIDLWIQVHIFYDHVNPVTRRTIDQSAGGKLRDLNAEESWAILEDLALYDNENARLSKFEADFKQQQSEMTNKIDTILKAITDRIAGTLHSDTVKNPKLGTHPVSSARSYPTIDPQCSSHPSNSINAIKAHFNEETWSGTCVVLELVVRRYLLGGAIDGSEANGIIRDPNALGHGITTKEDIGFTPRRRMGFRMELVQGATPICEGSCCSTSLERKEVWNDRRSCKVGVGSNGNLLWEAICIACRRKVGSVGTCKKVIIEKSEIENSYVDSPMEGARDDVLMKDCHDKLFEVWAKLPSGKRQMKELDHRVRRSEAKNSSKKMYDDPTRLTNRWAEYKKDIASCGRREFFPIRWGIIIRVMDVLLLKHVLERKSLWEMCSTIGKKRQVKPSDVGPFVILDGLAYSSVEISVYELSNRNLDGRSASRVNGNCVDSLDTLSFEHSTSNQDSFLV
ncbi:zinc finger, CCHC-type containing protein [Tanacetum coccineum]